MAYRKPVDEWGVIIQKQSELNKKRETEERQQRFEEKTDYRKDLLFQQQLRDVQKKEVLSQKQIDAQEVALRANYFKQQEDMRRNQESILKKQMGEDYMTHQNMIKQKEIEERQRKYQEEQAHLARVRQELEIEEQRKKDAREKWNMEQQMMLNFKREQETQKKLAEQQEKLHDIELMRQRKQREEEREQKYRDYYQKLNQYQNNNMERFHQFMTRDTKEVERATWIDKNVAEQNSLLAQKEEYEKYLKQMNIRNNNETLRLQMEEKERTRLMAIEEQRRHAEEHKRRVEESLRLEQEREMQKRMQKMQYNEDLGTQKNIWNEVQMNQFKLTEHEKKLNRNMIDEKALLQRGGAQILKNNGNISSSYEENMQKFFGSDAQSKTPPPNRQEKSVENVRKGSGQSFGLNRNNRIF
jgi:hypothetical protein